MQPQLSSHNCHFKPGVSNIWAVGQKWPTRGFNPVRLKNFKKMEKKSTNTSWWLYFVKICNIFFYIWIFSILIVLICRKTKGGNCQICRNFLASVLSAGILWNVNGVMTIYGLQVSAVRRIITYFVFSIRSSSVGTKLFVWFKEKGNFTLEFHQFSTGDRGFRLGAAAHLII